MAKQSVVIAAASAVGLVLWSALSGGSYPLVLLAAGALVTTRQERADADEGCPPPAGWTGTAVSRGG